MSNRTKQILGIGLFVLGMILPLFAVWRYTGFGLSRYSFRISATVFHLVLVADLAVFYAQWKVCPNVWLSVRAWFAEHAWSIFFGLTFMLVIQSLVFYRHYTTSYARFRLLRSDISDVDSKVEDVESKIGDVDFGGIAAKIDDLKKDVSNAEYSLEKLIKENQRTFTGQAERKSFTW